MKFLNLWRTTSSSAKADSRSSLLSPNWSTNTKTRKSSFSSTLVLLWHSTTNSSKSTSNSVSPFLLTCRRFTVRQNDYSAAQRKFEAEQENDQLREIQFRKSWAHVRYWCHRQRNRFPRSWLDHPSRCSSRSELLHPQDRQNRKKRTERTSNHLSNPRLWCC